MAKRIAQVDIKIGGIQTIGQLEAEMNKLNEEIKELEVGSKEFKKMQNEIAGLDDKLKTVNSQMEGVTSTEKAEGLLKMGEGFAGAAIAVQGLQTFLGGTSEELQKVIARVGGLILVLDGARRATEAFSAENIKRLRGLQRSFRGLGATIAQLPKMGKIGLLVAGVAAVSAAVVVLIRNWERIGSVIKNTLDGSRKRLRKHVKELEKVKAAQEGVTTAAQSEATARQELAEITGEYRDAANAAMDAQIENIENLQTELNLIRAQRGQNAMKIEGMRETRKKYKEITREIEAQDAQIEQLIATLELERQKLLTIGAQWNNIGKIIANKDAQKALENTLKMLESREFTERQIYNQQLRQIELQRTEIELTKQSNGEYTKAQKERLAQLEAERNALIEKERLRRRDLELQIEELDRGRDYEAQVRKINQALEANTIELEDITSRWQTINIQSEAALNLLEAQLERQRYISEEAASRIPFDKEGLRILEERLGFKRSELQLLIEFEGISLDVSSLSERTKLQYKLQLDEVRKIASAKLEILQNDKSIVAENIESLEIQREQYTELLNKITAREELLQTEKEGFEAQLANAKTREEEFYWMQRIQKVDDEIIGLQEERVKTGNEIESLNLEINNQLNEQQIINNEIKTIEDQRASEEERITYELEQQVRLSSRLNTFLDEYNKEIQAGRELIGQSFELWATFADRRAEMMQREFDKQMENLGIINDELADQQDLREDYEELLKDANAERRDEILASLAEIGEKETELQDQRDAANKAALEAQYEMELAQWKAAKRRKIAAIIDATIQGAISVVEALPNVVLAAIVGALSAAAIGTIIAQPLPPKPEKPQFAEGGYTGEGDKYEVAGVVHKGEYVVPKSVVERDSSIVGILESMRLGMKGYAEGGMVTAPTTTNKTTTQNYNELAEQIANSLRINPPVVSVVEITDKQNRVRIIENTASF